MRKITVAEFISLDGVVEAPDAVAHALRRRRDDAAHVVRRTADADTMLLGRVTYESFAGAFAGLPDDDPVGGQMNRPAKVVVLRHARPS